MDAGVVKNEHIFEIIPHIILYFQYLLPDCGFDGDSPCQIFMTSDHGVFSGVTHGSMFFHRDGPLQVTDDLMYTLVHEGRMFK